MATWTTYKGLQVPDVSTGDAGINLTANLKLLADNFGTILADAGTVTAPSHSFSGDTNTGMWSAGADLLAFSTAGTERVRINSAYSSSGANVLFQSGKNEISVHLGTGDTAGYLSSDYSGAIRFNGASVNWGDLAYYPNGGSTNGHFRFTLDGTTVGGTPNANIGVAKLFASAGSAAAPSITFFGDQDTGVYNSTGNSVDITAGGTRTVAVSTNQFRAISTVGEGLIRTTSSTLEFHVRPFSGSPGYVTWTEDSVADRWALGIKPSDSNLYLATGAPGSLTDRFVFSSAGNLTLKHLVGGTSTPSSAAGAGAGTSPTVSVAGTDAAGEVSVTTGTSPTASAVVVTITFNAAYGAAPYVVFSPSNGNAAKLSGNSAIYVTTTTTTFVFNVGSSALTASTAYKWHYQVVQ